MSCRCECGWPVYSDNAVSVTCPQCAGTIDCDGTLPAAEPLDPVACERWPFWARMVKLLRDDTDVGVGDTVHRLLTEIGAERFKTLAEQIGIPCGCDKRRDTWNKRFPYKLLEPPHLTSAPG